MPSDFAPRQQPGAAATVSSTCAAIQRLATASHRTTLEVLSAAILRVGEKHRRNIPTVKVSDYRALRRRSRLH